VVYCSQGFVGLRDGLYNQLVLPRHIASHLTQTRSSSSIPNDLLLATATMHASLTSLAAFGAIVQLLPGASAHGFVNLIKAGGKFYPGWDLNYYYQTNPPAVAGWSTTALDSGFVCPLQPTTIVWYTTKSAN
jgi:hypothetical protein